MVGALRQQFDTDPQAGVLLVHQTDMTAVLMNDLLGDGKPQTGAAGFAGACFVNTVKTFKDSISILFRDTDTVVIHFHPDGIFLLTGGAPTNPAASSAAGSVGYTDLLVTWLFKITTGAEAAYNIASVIGILVFVAVAVISLVVYNVLPSIKNEEDFQ